MRRWMGSIPAVVLGGVVMAVVLFGITAWTPGYAYVGPLCEVGTIANPGFDPWTGVPHGRTFKCAPTDESPTRLVTADPPDDLIARRAVPLPVGLLVSVCIALASLTIRSVADRRQASDAEATSG